MLRNILKENYVYDNLPTEVVNKVLNQLRKLGLQFQELEFIHRGAFKSGYRVKGKQKVVVIERTFQFTHALKDLKKIEDVRFKHVCKHFHSNVFFINETPYIVSVLELLETRKKEFTTTEWDIVADVRKFVDDYPDLHTKSGEEVYKMILSDLNVGGYFEYLGEEYDELLQNPNQDLITAIDHALKGRGELLKYGIKFNDFHLNNILFDRKTGNWKLIDVI